jgi:argonaute-like protein implicated in RNA metabolism and viral defense
MGVKFVRTGGYLIGSVLPEVLLSFRSMPYGDEHAHYDPYLGLRLYGPYRPTKVKIIHLISKEWINRGMLTQNVAEYFEQVLKNHLGHLFEKDIREVELKRVDVNEITSLISEEQEKVREKEEELSETINEENCVVLTFIPPLLKVTRQGSLLYSRLKILGLKSRKRKFVVQCYSQRVLNALNQGEEGKFVLSNLALNIFAKSGGIPWILSSSYKLDYNIVVGVAWSIKRVTSKSTGPTIKYYGVTHIFDERGAWKNFVTFACRPRTQDLLSSIVGSLREIVLDSKFDEKESKILLLLRERPRREVMEKFLKTLKTNINTSRVDVVRVSEGAPLRVYNPYLDNYLPPRGLFFELSDDRACMVTTGMYKGKYVGIGTPRTIRIELLHTTEEKKKAALRGAVKACYALTAMNWRSLFGSLRLPTPIHYAKLMAQLLRICLEDDINEAFDFEHKKLKTTDVEVEWNLLKPRAFRDRPWFI